MSGRIRRRKLVHLGSCLARQKSEIIVERGRKAGLVPIARRVGHLTHGHSLAAKQLESVAHPALEPILEHGNAKTSLESALEFGLTHTNRSGDITNPQRSAQLGCQYAPSDIQLTRFALRCHRVWRTVRVLRDGQ